MRLRRVSCTLFLFALCFFKVNPFFSFCKRKLLHRRFDVDVVAVELLLLLLLSLIVVSSVVVVVSSMCLI